MMDDILTLKQQEFCKHYIENKGNAVKSYMKAFETKNYDTAKVEASKLLTNPNIKERINKIMEENGFNDIYVDLELRKMIMQDDYSIIKLRAISEYNKLKRRYEASANNTPINTGVIILPARNKEPSQ